MAFVAFVLAIGMFFWSSSQREPQVSDGDKPVVAASFYPLAFFAERVAGDALTVTMVTPGGVEPHDFEPSPQDIVRLQQADLFVYNGAGLDPWAEKMKTDLENQGVKTIDITQALQALGVSLLVGEEDGDEDHEGEESEDHGLYDPHVWLDPTYAMLMTDIIASSLAELFPQHRSGFQTRAAALRQDLMALDVMFKQQLVNCVQSEIIVSHDAFSYMASRYGFEIIPIAGFSPQEQPSARRLGELATLARTKGIKTIFFETLASPKLSETLAQEVGATTAVLDPIEGSTGPTYIELMEANAAALRLALECR